MGDDLKASIEALTKNMELMQKSMENMQKSIEANAKAIHDLATTGSSASGGRPGTGEHHQDRPPKH
jgi:DNA-binding protein YbaB